MTDPIREALAALIAAVELHRWQVGGSRAVLDGRLAEAKRALAAPVRDVPLENAAALAYARYDATATWERESDNAARHGFFAGFRAGRDCPAAAPVRDIQPEPFAWAYAYMDEFCEAFRFREDAEARMAKANEIRPAYRAKRDVRPLYTAPPCPAAAATRTNEVVASPTGAAATTQGGTQPTERERLLGEALANVLIRAGVLSSGGTGPALLAAAESYCATQGGTEEGAPTTWQEAKAAQQEALEPSMYPWIEPAERGEAGK